MLRNFPVGTGTCGPCAPSREAMCSKRIDTVLQVHYLRRVTEGGLISMQPDTTIKGPVAMLTAEYAARRKRSPEYSLRDFATALGLSSGALSELLAGKRKMGPRLAARLAERLGLSPDAHQKFMRQVRDVQWSGDADGRQGATHAGYEDDDFRTLCEDDYRLVADWEHYAILSLIKTKNFRSDPHWIAMRLGLSVHEAMAALQRLLRLGLLARENGKLCRTTPRVTTTRDVPSAAIRAGHKQTLEQAIECIESVGVDMRDLSGITIPVDPARIPEMKEAIREFRRGFMERFSTGELTEVYNMNIQLVPLTKRRKS